MEEHLNDLHDFQELKHYYFDLGHEFRQVVIEYDINHDLIKEKTINIFLKQKSFLYLLSEKRDDESIDYSNDDTLTMDNKQEKEDIENARKHKQNKKQEILDNNNKQEKINDLKEEITK